MLTISGSGSGHHKEAFSRTRTRIFSANHKGLFSRTRTRKSVKIKITNFFFSGSGSGSHKERPKALPYGSRTRARAKLKIYIWKTHLRGRGPGKSRPLWQNSDARARVREYFPGTAPARMFLCLRGRGFGKWVPGPRPRDKGRKHTSIQFRFGMQNS